ncbi:GNAT family N-acetyltransferase [Ktedonobacter racemifer]|uniref:GCN5-related N-acetyltransferase n=1 Tax=Ktedonobacter racemifer DSM 44963 TaxID=485913 RepID=D6TCR3_KTERA|nr:GNAT family N-acetyltransferase [Ktedonobacter racemifer]EFH88177.1 GCN5-related N-acetyltransferase [Ktedonobacter racemifer DSM 44963]
MSNTQATLTLPDAPAIPGLVFRLFQGEVDFPAIEAVRKQVQAVDGDIWLPGPDTDPDDVCNPLHDCLIVEVDGQVIGYTWLTWWSEPAVELFLHLGWLVPEWRRKGIGRALLRWQEQRLRQIVQVQPTTKPCVFGGNADETQPGNRALLLSEGYTLAFTIVWMTCQLPTEPIQLTPLPDGLEIRQVSRDQLPAIYAANVEAFSESHDSLETYETWLRELGGPDLDTSLWVVAWDGDQIAGHVISTSDEAGAHTPWVGIRRPWRRRGLGKALMTRMLQRCQERGIQQADIGTRAENPGKSLHLYESVGYQIVSRHPRYRKPL